MTATFCPLVGIQYLPCVHTKDDTTNKINQAKCRMIHHVSYFRNSYSRNIVKFHNLRDILLF